MPPIYFVDAKKDASEMAPVIENESELHRLIKEFPGILTDQKLLLIGDDFYIHSKNQPDFRESIRPDLVFVNKDGQVIVIELKANILNKDTIGQIWSYHSVLEEKDYQWFQTTYYKNNNGSSFDEKARELFEFDEDEYQEFVSQVNTSYALVLVAPSLTGRVKAVINSQAKQEINISGIEVKSYKIPDIDPKIKRVMNSTIVAGNREIFKSTYRGTKMQISKTDPSRELVSILETYIREELETLSKADESYNLYVKSGNGRYRLVMDEIMERHAVRYSLTIHDEGTQCKLFIETVGGQGDWNNHRADINHMFEGELDDKYKQGNETGKSHWIKKLDLSKYNRDGNKVAVVVVPEFLELIKKTYNEIKQFLQSKEIDQYFH